MWCCVYRLLHNGAAVFSSIEGLLSRYGWKQVSELAWKYLESNIVIVTGTANELKEKQDILWQSLKG